jgi:hypothetical protein
MVYARAHDQTVAEDYFAAMERVEQRLEIVPAGQKDMEVVKVQEPAKVLQLIEQLEIPELCYEGRLGIARQLREAWGNANEHAPPEDNGGVISGEDIFPQYCRNQPMGTWHPTSLLH